ncbi:MAG: phosphonate metabolism protein/1,5-bisphosphokinase (PRPP-forming) PhnN [Hyphomicrobiaceae bacterium]
MTDAAAEATACAASGPTLVLVVGPSGAGKDTLIDAARAVFAGDPRFVFARRIITRVSDGATEDNDTLSPEAFDAAEIAGKFLLSWRAHGLGYAIAMEGWRALGTGQVLVANVSRAVIADAERKTGQVVVLHVTAPLPVLARRIAARGRETEADIAKRLARQMPLSIQSAEVLEIVNDGALEEAAARFNAALRAVADRRAEHAG